MMQKRMVEIPVLKTLVILIVFFILLFIILITPSFTVEVAGSESGGTDDHISLNATTGRVGFQWNVTHGFELFENGTSVTDPFNITISERVKYAPNEERFNPNGHIFGELNEIRYDDEPEPIVQISQEDFEYFKESETNLTITILGEYHRNNGKKSELRQAYIQITITKNEKPLAAAMVTEQQEDQEGNWTGWKNMTHQSTLTYYVPINSDDIRLYFNASKSTDPEGVITDYQWDLDEDGKFGGIAEIGVNVSRILTVGKSYQFGLIVSDGEYLSEPLLFTIRIQQPLVYPDLTIHNFSIRNLNNMDHFRKYDWMSLEFKLNNIGLNSTGGEDFHVELDFKYGDDGEFEYLWNWTITDDIDPGNTISQSFLWDTTKDEFPAGNYSFRLVLDVHDIITESNETNNIFEFQGIYLEPDNIPGEPAIFIQGIDVSKKEVIINEMVFINVTIINVGSGHAKYVDVYYYIINELQYFLTFERLAREGGSHTASFVFSPDSTGGFVISFIVMDNGVETDRSDDISIFVQRPDQSTNLRFLSITPSRSLILTDEDFEIYVVVENIGDITARFLDVSLRFSYGNGEIHEISFIESIEPGSNATITFQLSLTYGGDYYFMFNITDNGIEKDADYLSIRIWYYAPYDPVISSILFIPNPAHSGESVRLGAYVSSYPSKIISYRWHSSLIGEFYNGSNRLTSMRFNRTGTHILTLTVIDDNGVTAQRNETLIVLPADDEPPSLQVTSVERSWNNNSIFLIKGVAADNEQVLSVEYRILGTEDWLLAIGTKIWTIELDISHLNGTTVALEIRSWDGTNHSEPIKEVIDTRENGYSEEEDETGLSIYLVFLGLVGLGALFMLSRKYA